MKSSKPIDRLFQEGLKDFQSSPSPKLWDGIEAKLSNKNRRKRILPFWWQVASVAAILLIFSTIGAFYYNTSTSRKVISSRENPKFKSNTNFFEVITTRYRFSSVKENLSSFENTIESSFAFQIDEQFQNNTVVNSEENSRIAEKSIFAINELNSSLLNSTSNLTLTTTLFEPENFKFKNEASRDNKKSLFDVIEETSFVAFDDKKTIEKPWIIQPNVAPVFMNSLNGGNPIEPSLRGKTSSNPNISFGINVAYAINKKVKIRTGLNQVAMGYNTQDVILSTPSFSAVGSSYIKSNYVGEVTLVSAVNNREPMSESTNSVRVSAMGFNPIGSINHELGFLEVPLEVEYAIINKKLGLHLLGGASTYLLNNNEVFFEERGRSTNIGEAENLNTFSFSANFGLGMDYNFSETLSLNLEPKFMYQINTFQSNSSHFQPYFFGIYSGIKFKF